MCNAEKHRVTLNQSNRILTVELTLTEGEERGLEEQGVKGTMMEDMEALMVGMVC